MKKVGLILLSISLLCGCVSSKQNQDSSSLVVNQLVTKSDYRIDLTRAFPQSGAFSRMAVELNLFQGASSPSAIDLNGYAAFIEFKNDTVTGTLPFFGERYFGNSYRQNNSIRFKGVPEKYSVIRVENHVESQFTIRDQNYPTEIYTVSITAYGNRKAIVSVTSSQRSTMRYSGTMTLLMQKKQNFNGN